MNKKLQETVRNVNFALFANLVSIFTSGVITLVAPKYLDEINYGYWQLYLFYSAYVGFFHIGLQDGIYLRYGGVKYEELDRKKMHSQFTFLILLILFEAICIMFISPSIGTEHKQFILLGFVIMMLLYLPNAHLLYILQMTMRIREYSINLIIEKLLFFIGAIYICVVGETSFVYLISADILGKFVALLYTAKCCKEIIFSKGCNIGDTIKEAYQNIRAGIKLLFANIAGIFITGIPRYSIEQNWGISTFGKVSLVFSLCNFFIIFVTAIGQVLFPVLKRTDEKLLPKIYSMINLLTTYILTVLIIVYQPMKVILSMWLPQYYESFLMFAILFPMCIFEAKVSMIFNTYYKALRMEKKLFLYNVISVLVCMSYTLVATIYFQNLSIMLIGITIVSGLRCIMLEICLSKKLSINWKKNVIAECMSSILFVLINCKVGSGIIAFILYFIVILLYTFVQRKDLLKLYSYTTELLNLRKE